MPPDLWFIWIDPTNAGTGIQFLPRGEWLEVNAYVAAYWASAGRPVRLGLAL